MHGRMQGQWTSDRALGQWTSVAATTAQQVTVKGATEKIKLKLECALAQALQHKELHMARTFFKSSKRERIQSRRQLRRLRGEVER